MVAALAAPIPLTATLAPVVAAQPVPEPVPQAVVPAMPTVAPARRPMRVLVAAARVDQVPQARLAQRALPVPIRRVQVPLRERLPVVQPAQVPQPPAVQAAQAPQPLVVQAVRALSVPPAPAQAVQVRQVQPAVMAVQVAQQQTPLALVRLAATPAAAMPAATAPPTEMQTRVPEVRAVLVVRPTAALVVPAEL